MIDTINSLFAIDIDYYVKIDFKGFVELLDEIHGKHREFDVNGSRVVFWKI